MSARPNPPPSDRPGNEFDASKLCRRFEQFLTSRRLNHLQQRVRSNSPDPFDRPPHRPDPGAAQPAAAQPSTASPPSHLHRRPLPAPPTRSPYGSIPLMPSPPQDGSSWKFRNHLVTLSFTPIKYENPGLLDEALAHVPLQTIYEEANEEHNIALASAESMGEHVRPQLGYLDCVIRALLRWFRHSFFTFVNNPECSVCHAPTIAQGRDPPVPDEAARGAHTVELYRCSNAMCNAAERFPRFTDVWPLLQTRRGRCGEWANCFAMLCRAVGARVRWVWNSEDHVWVEVYSIHQERWIHVDPCEEAWDNPRLYAEGWRKKMAYCIAFSADGATDVTRRYVRKPAEFGLERSRCPEAVLMGIMQEIKKMRRENMDKPDRMRLVKEDCREEKELSGYVAQALTADMVRQIPLAAPSTSSTTTANPASDEVKLPAGRDSGSPTWVAARGEDGSHATRRDQDSGGR